MKTSALLRFVLVLAIAFGAAIQAGNTFLGTTAWAEEDIPAVNSSHRRDEVVPLTDRVPWLIYFVLSSSSLALALILISLARARTRDAEPDDEKQA